MFRHEHLTRIGQASSLSPDFFTYETNDARDIYEAAGYFNKTHVDLKLGDVIVISSNGFQSIYRITQESPCIIQNYYSLPSDTLGWVSINDLSKTSANPLTVQAARTKLSINSDEVIDAYAPRGTSQADYYDNATKKIKSPVLGSSYCLRLNFKARPAQNNASITYEYDIGGSQGVIMSGGIRLFKGGNAITPVTITSYNFTLETYIANGAEIFLTPTHVTEIFDVSLVIGKMT